MQSSSKLKVGYIGLVLALLYLPVLVLIVLSVNDSTYSMQWHGFSLAWYQELGRDQEIWLAAFNSLILGLSAATCATLLGSLAAINIYRYRFFGKRAIHACMFVLLIAPEIILGIALLLLFNIMQIKLGFLSLLCAHITFCLPFVAITVYSTLSGCDTNIFEAAKDLGASEFVVVRKIIFPMLWPALLAGWLLSFTLSLDDVMISYFVSGPEFEILPLKIFALARLGLKPELNALCTIMFGVTLCLVVAAHHILKRQQSNREINYAV